MLRPSAAGAGPLRGTAGSWGLVAIARIAGIAAITVIAGIAALAKVAALAKLMAVAATHAAIVPLCATAAPPVLLLQLQSISLISIACRTL